MSGTGPELFIVAGEPSGDTHGAHLLSALRSTLPGVAARGLGGPKLAAAGMTLLHDLASDAVMGLFPVVKAFPRLRRIFHAAVADLKARPPKALILIDYPGFNMRLAARAKRLGIPVVYYIGPQVWAWARGRIRRLKETVDLMLVILPFEEDVYRGSGLRAVYVGHPLLDHLRTVTPSEAAVARLRGRPGTPLIGVFPGSRRHVVESLLPVFAEAARRVRTLPGTENARFAVALAKDEFRGLADRYVPRELPTTLEVGRPYDVMAAADLCLASSGTTTLEIAAFGKPYVIGYKVSPLLYAIGRLVIAVPHIGLVNLVANRGVVPEHVHWRSFGRALGDDLHRLWTDEATRNAQLEGLAEVRRRLETPGSYRRAAEEIAGLIASRGA